MKEFNAERVAIETAGAHGVIKQAKTSRTHPAYIGLDVHKETITVAIALPRTSALLCFISVVSGLVGASF